MQWKHSSQIVRLSVNELVSHIKSIAPSYLRSEYEANSNMFLRTFADEDNGIIDFTVSGSKYHPTSLTYLRMHTDGDTVVGVSCRDGVVLPLYGLSNYDVAMSICRTLYICADNIHLRDEWLQINDYVSNFTNSDNFGIQTDGPHTRWDNGSQINQLIGHGNLTCLDTTYSFRWTYASNWNQDIMGEPDEAYDKNTITLVRRHKQSDFEPIAYLKIEDGEYRLHVVSTGWEYSFKSVPDMVFLTRYLISVASFVKMGALVQSDS